MDMSIKHYILIFGMLFSGTINTVSKKVQLDCIALGYFNHTANDTRTPHNFNKPWFQTLLMFFGEGFCIFAFLIMRFRKKRQILAHGFSTIGVHTRGHSLVSTPVFNWIFLLPTCCDLLGSTLAGIGLLYIDASIWQMLRGSLIVFAGILSVIFLKRRLRYFQWTGIMITVIGLALVGSKSVFSEHSIKTTVTQSAIAHSDRALWSLVRILPLPKFSFDLPSSLSHQYKSVKPRLSQIIQLILFLYTKIISETCGK
ncbi:unnamed protein product [Heterobilharzia americana]|nr:unnamed protein product [Heterobilharzia americana]